jgi:hypothetical protein
MAQNDVEAKVRLVVDSKTYNAALKQANKEAKEFKRQQSSAFKGAGDDISKAFGNAIGVIGKLAPALSASAGALAVAKKAMQENQSITDEWARVTEGAKASWEGFVDSIVNADFGSYFSNMGRMIQQARDAADAMDTLGTTQIFSSRAMSEFELKIRQARIVIKDPNSTAEQRKAAGRAIEEAQAGKISTAQRLSDDYMQAFAAKLADYVSRKGVNASASDFIEQGVDGRWQIRKGSLFDKYYGNLGTYEEAAARYAREKQLRSTVVGSVGMGQWGSQAIYGKGNMSDAEFEELRAFVEMSDDKLKELFGLFSSSRQELSRVYTEMTENFEYLNKAKGLTGGGSGSRVGEVFAEGSIGWVKQEIAKTNKEYESAVTEGERQAAQARLKVLQEELEVLKSGKISTDKLAPLGVDTPTGLFNPTDITAPTWRANIDIKQQKTLGKVTEDALQRVSNLTDVIGKLGIVSMFTGGEVDKTTAIIGRIVQIVGSAIGGPAGGVFASLGSLIAGGFATGGIVGGTSYKGDKLTAQVSSGEMILNKAQQRNLLAIAGGGGAPSVTAVEIRGDKMVLLINNYLRQQGKSTIG